MKYNGLDFDTTFELTRVEEETFIPIVRNMKGRQLHGEFIGSVEIVVGCEFDYDDGYDYVTEYFLAYRLDNGPIVAVEFHIDDLREGNTTPVFSLAKKMFSIHEGLYPDGFPEKWKGFKHIPCEMENVDLAPVDPTELPF